MHHSKIYGGLGGGPYDDKSSWQYNSITAIRLECSNIYIHSIQMKYGDIWALKHGGVSPCATDFPCKSHTKALNAAGDERIESVEMILGKAWWNLGMIYKATFITNKGELIACGGDSPPSGRTSESFKGYRLQYISGRSGQFVDNLKFHWTEK